MISASKWRPLSKKKIARLQKEESAKKPARKTFDEEKAAATRTGRGAALDRLEHLMREMNDRLKSIESHLTRQ